MIKPLRSNALYSRTPSSWSVSTSRPNASSIRRTDGRRRRQEVGPSTTPLAREFLDIETRRRGLSTIVQ